MLYLSKAKAKYYFTNANINFKELNIMTNALINKFTNKNRAFKFAPDKKYIKVYINGQLNGFIWNNSNTITIDGNKVVSSKFFQ